MLQPNKKLNMQESHIFNFSLVGQRCQTFDGKMAETFPRQKNR